MVAPAPAAARGALSHMGHLELDPSARSAQKQKWMELEQTQEPVMAGHGKTKDTESLRFRHGKIAGVPLASHSLQSIRSGLPPTPPQQNGEEAEEPLVSPSVLSDIYQSAVTSPIMQVSTPVHLTSPPTPDTTPPSRRERLRVPKNNLSHYPSLSQADSFVTARETMHSQSSSRSQALVAASEGDNPLRSSRQPSPTPSRVTAIASTDGGHVTSRTKDGARPSEQIPRSKKHVHRRIPSMQESEQLRPGIPTPRKHVNEVTATGVDMSPGLQNKSIDSSDSSSPSPPRKSRHNRQTLSAAAGSSASVNSLSHQAARDAAVSHDALYTHLRDEKSKRLSAHSASSTIVEAIVYTSPDQPRRCLRHAGKNLALRDDVKNSSKSRRSSSDSYESVHEHHLRHQRSPLPGRGFGAGRGGIGQAKPRAVSSPETLEKSDWPTHRPSDPGPALFALRTLSKPAKRLTHVSQRPAMPELEHLHLAGAHGDNRAERTEDVPSTKRGSSPNQHEAQVDSSAIKLSGRQIDDHADLNWPLPPTADLQEAHRRNDSVQTDDNKPQGLHLMPFSSGLEAGPPMSSPRRGSLEPRMELGLARHHLSSYTPLSEWSDRTHNAEVNMATAVNIYPHNNESVLVIQQTGNGSTQQTNNWIQDLATPEPSPRIQQSTPSHPKFEAFLQESTPPPQKSSEPHTHGVDSPLLNPRAAPEPPVFKFIPPTPNDDEDRQLGSDMRDGEPFSMNATEALPVRRQSLREKAVAHSSAILDAILLRQPSTRTYRRYSTSGSMDEARRRNLHPFWRPRGFWDDFDSDDEDYDDEPLESDNVHPLPRGGDTSDVRPTVRNNSRRHSFPRKMSTRLPGFRGSGGFLIGNSLGINRHGTNNRRPHISLPLNLVPSNPLRPRTSQLSTRALGALSREGSVRNASGGVAKLYRVPGMGLRGLRGIRESIRGVRRTHAERAAEKRRQQLRSMIGVRITHGA